MRRDRRDAAQPDVGQRAHGQRGARRPPAGAAARDPPRCGCRGPPAPPRARRSPAQTLFGRPFLAGVRDPVQPEPAGGVEDGREIARRVADLGRVEPDGEQLIRVPGERVQGPGRVSGAAVAQEARRSAPPAGPPLAALRSAAARSPPMTSASGTPRDRCICGSKKISGPRHPVLPRPGEVRRREIGEVLRRSQHRHALVVQGKERAQVTERIGLPAAPQRPGRAASRRCGRRARAPARVRGCPRCAGATRPSAGR